MTLKKYTKEKLDFPAKFYSTPVDRAKNQLTFNLLKFVFYHQVYQNVSLEFLN